MNKKSKIFVVAVVLSIVLLVLAGCGNNSSTEQTSTPNITNIFSSIENKVITKENFEELSNKYGEANKDTDNALYFSYACMYYMMQDGMASAFNFSLTDEQKEEAMYQRIYGKTINDLIKEGKDLMAANNITPDEYRQSIENLPHAINDFNKSVEEFNNN